ncbi:helix-turn-helix transcriptional regulator [Mesorhizobium sp. SP-1A]|uniref:helix-turn-helix domain-containing protein n=1 Tax=Mesorhizobium sp. SP-1A TaxID=3077840 RepID=UPI0028F711B0|nr:helix-turn-helix transcriptional regulator [Mesorhizobium sp. SP-1A]
MRSPTRSAMLGAGVGCVVAHSQSTKLEVHRLSDTTTIFEQEQDLDTFGGRLSRARAASYLTTKELSLRLGVKPSTVKAWECDRSQPSAHRISKLAGLLNVSLSWLLHGVGTAPVEAEDETAADVIGEQLAKLKLLHAETGQLIGRIETRLDTLAQPPLE